MFYRFLYITWRIFWSSLLVLAATVILFAGAIILMLQTDPVRGYLTERAEKWFNTNFEGTLHIGEVRGFLPVQVELHDVLLEHEDRTIVSLETLRLRTDLIALLRSSVTVNDLALINPVVYLRTDDQHTYTISRAFNRIDQDDTPIADTDEDKPTPMAHAFRTVELYAPFIHIHNGTLHVDDPPSGITDARFSEPFRIDSINTEFFLEISRGQRYLDISYLTLIPDNLDRREFTLSGQVYNDRRFLEFNVMRMRFGRSHLDWNLEFDGINLFAENLFHQFGMASWTLEVKDLFLDEEQLFMAGVTTPDNFPGLSAVFDAAGSGNLLMLSNAEVKSGQSGIRFQAELADVLDSDKFTYNADVLEVQLHDSDLAMLVPRVSDLPFHDWSAISVLGSIRGQVDTMHVDLDMKLSEGSFRAGGTLDLKQPLSLEMSLYGTELNPATLQGLESWPGLLNTELFLKAENILDSNYRITVDLDVFDSRLLGYNIPDMHVDLSYSNRILTHEFGYYQQDSYLSGRGSVNFQDEWPHFLVRGSSSGFDLSALADETTLPESEWNMNYDINWHGTSPDEWYGRIVVDVFPSKLNGTDLASHQLYLDMNHPASDIRSLRLTSSVADLVMEGDITLTALPGLLRQWQGYFARQIREDILFQTEDPTAPYRASEGDLLSADIFFELKNLGLLRAYLPALPEISSRMQLDAELHADHEKLEIVSTWQDDSSSWNGFAISRSDISLDVKVHFDQPLREALALDLDLTVGQLTFMEQQLDSISWSLSAEQGAITSRTRIDNFGNEVRFVSDIDGVLDKAEIAFTLENLLLGNQRYLWVAENRPVFRFGDDGKLMVRDLRLSSGNDRIFVNGTFSNDPADSVEYRFVNVDLERISQMIDGKVGFQGLLDGNLVTRNLAVNPVFHGRLDVDRLAFNDRIIGDVTLSSTYNPELERFDTKLLVVTDEEKYADYIERNNGRKQHVTATGWLRAPDMGQPSDSLYYFDVEVVELDAWVLRYLMESIFDSIEGRATGRGYLTGNLSEFDFHGDFEILESEVVPAFLEPNYRLDGLVSVNRHDGVILERLNVRDDARGRGVVTGHFDFNDFQPEKFMDITLEMQNLRFLDNSDGPDVPLFGRIAGTGVVNISGSNVSPFVRTIEPVTTSSQSRLSIPLVGQSVDEAQGRFIRFVNDFDEVDIRRQIVRDPAVLREIDRTFMEVFRMDLQFIAGPNSIVQLIFDPVTGEIVNAQGSGRVRVILEDEDLQIFGNFDITSGDYLFIGGDILTRRFTLREGGAIRLEGDPTNALLDLTAVYRARPNIAPLLGASLDQTNRIPVELLLRITGPIDNIENDFYFEFPNAIDASQNAAVLNILNSEEQKLIQATSLLFTGGFISGALVGDTQTQELGTTLQARAGQVGISQLLSTQINTLLSDNLLNVDVDLNLLGFDQADLAIALRLFDDRLVLRREGEVGGEETNIGDLGATYRINPNLSVEVFHRKDPMLMSILGTQADVENVNGVGLEAQFRFNSWREFGNRVWRNVTTLFGLVGSRDEPRAGGEEPIEGTDDDERETVNLSHPVFGILNEITKAEELREDSE